MGDMATREDRDARRQEKRDAEALKAIKGSDTPVRVRIHRETTRFIRVDIDRDTLKGWKNALEALETALGKDADGRETVSAYSDGYGRHYFQAHTKKDE